MKIIQPFGRQLRVTIVIIVLLLAMKSASLFAAVSGLNGDQLRRPRAADASEAHAATARPPMVPAAAALGPAPTAQARPTVSRPGAPTNERGVSPVQHASARNVAEMPAPTAARPVPAEVPGGGASNPAAGLVNFGTGNAQHAVPESPASDRPTANASAGDPAAKPQNSEAVGQAGAASPPPGDAPPAETFTLRRTQFEERERQLVEREAVAAATEKRLSDRIAELGALQGRLQALQSALQERDEANWTGLVKLYEGMRPRDAAVIFNALDKKVLLELLDRMKPGKVGPVMALMEPEKARQATADLAAKRTQSTTVVN